MTTPALLLIAVMGYLLGSFPSGVVVVRFWKGEDLRGKGSGHTGGMNVRRVAGIAPAIIAVLGDAAKAILAVKLAEIWGPQPWAVPVAATTAIVGHCWPLYTRFRGGMGLASASFILLYVSPLSLIILVAVWPLWYLIFRHRYRASAATALTTPLALWISGNAVPTIALGVAVGLTIFVRHVPELGSSIPNPLARRG